MDAEKLVGLEPKNVFSYFEKICSIPHCSGTYNANFHVIFIFS